MWNAISILLNLSARGFGSGLTAARGYAKTFGESVTSYFTTMLNPMNMAMAVIKQIGASFQRLVQLGRIQVLTGIPAAQLRAVGMAAQKMGMDADEAVGVVRELHQAMLEANSQGARAALFQNLGIDVEGLKDGSENAVSAMAKIIAYTERMGTSTETAFNLIRALGPELAQKMMPLINAGSGNFKGFVTDSDVSKLQEAADQAWHVQQRFDGIKQGLESAGMKAVIWVSMFFNGLMTVVGLILQAIQVVVNSLGLALSAIYNLATGNKKQALADLKQIFTVENATTGMGADLVRHSQGQLKEDWGSVLGTGKQKIPKPNLALESQLFIPQIVAGAADKLQSVGGGGNAFSPGMLHMDLVKQSLAVAEEHVVIARDAKDILRDMATKIDALSSFKGVTR